MGDRRLYLVNGAARGELADVAWRPSAAPSGRPGDRRDRWDEVEDDAVAALVEAALAEGMAVAIAAAVAVELHLLEADLADAGRGSEGTVERLDRVAARARLRRALPPACAGYLRELLRPREPGADAERALALPLRLHGRLSNDVVSTAYRQPRLARARAWEAAALMDGRTMSEWALLQTLVTTGTATARTDGLAPRRTLYRTATAGEP